jgi:hypothetical protein
VKWKEITMTKEKQILEMAEAIEQARIKATDTTNSMNYGFGGWYAKELYNAGYRKIYDDHQRQCTCYALGCQMAEELKSDVAREIFEEIEKLLKENLFTLIPPYRSEITDWKTVFRLKLADDIAELKKKYESEKDNG